MRAEVSMCHLRCWRPYSLWRLPLVSPQLLRPETIQATYSQAGNTIGVTLIVYNYSTPSDLQTLSQAFQKGQDRELATALSITKAVGHCSITGALSYDVDFIQMVPTPTGRQIIFITSRPHPVDESGPPGAPQSYDLAVGQFDLNDTDPAKSTGFLFPASKLVSMNKESFTMIWLEFPGRWPTLFTQTRSRR